MKKCTTCGEQKSLDMFYKSATYKDGLSYRCKTCDYAARNAYHKKHYHLVREKLRANQRKSKYGLDEEAFTLLLAKQGGKCGICFIELSQEFGRHHLPNKLVVDHCHVTGKVRGLLCTKCNKGIGLLGDSIDSLYKALEYLKDADIH